MKLSKALSGIAAAAALLLPLAACADDGGRAALPQVDFRSVIESSPYKPVGFALDYMAELVSKRTGGRFTISRRMSYGGISASDCLVRVVVNTEDITVVPLEIIGNFMPWVRIMCLPYFFSQRDYDALAASGAAGRELCDRISEDDARIIDLGTWYSDYLELLMRDHPVSRPEDLRGQNIWLPVAGPISEYIASMGANPVIMPMDSATAAVRRGIIDGMVTPLNGLAAKSQAFAHMRYASQISMARAGYAVLVSQQKFESLPPEYQKVLREAAAEAGDFLSDYNEECAHVVLGRLRRNGSVALNSPDLTQFKAYADRVKFIYLKRYPQAAERTRNLLYGRPAGAGARR